MKRVNHIVNINQTKQPVTNIKNINQPTNQITPNNAYNQHNIPRSSSISEELAASN